VAGNTPAAGLQTAIRGLLVGAYNLIKLPSDGLPQLEEFRSLLPAFLAARVELSRERLTDWIQRAEVVIVFGSDETIEEIRKSLRPDQIFVPHGHRISFGVIFEDPQFESVHGAAWDASTFDQLGCLSPQVFYVQREPRIYAERLAAAMEQFHGADHRGGVSLSTANAIRALREETAFRAANGEDCTVWQSADSTAWTVIYDTAPGFPRSPLHRTIFVKTIAVLDSELRPIRSHLSCAGIFPANAENAARVAEAGVSRICPIGQMQRPPWTWHQDGSGALNALVRWVDAELEPGATNNFQGG